VFGPVLVVHVVHTAIRLPPARVDVNATLQVDPDVPQVAFDCTGGEIGCNGDRDVQQRNAKKEFFHGRTLQTLLWG